jgi:hypothetical protein
MANIPVIPGVKVSTKGILNKSMKDIICAILFGGLKNMLKGPLLCVSADLDKLISEYTDLPNLKDLKDDLKELKDQLRAAEDALGIKEGLGRVNGAIAEVQSLLALNGLCAIPMKAPPITDVLGQVIDSEFAEMNSILNDLGRLSKPELCLSGNGGLSTGSYNPKSILGSIQKHLSRMEDIPSNALSTFKKRIQGVGKALKKSVDRQLFPDFRHKHNLVTGKPYVPGQTYVQAGLAAPGSPNANTPVPVITLAPAPPRANQWNGPYPPADAPNLKEATAQAQVIVASVGKTASYPVDSNGVRSQNIWPGMLGPDLYALAVTALTPQDPLFAQKEAIYDYCGKLVGYTADIVSGDENYAGGDPTADADLNPPIVNFNFVWIEDRQCWAVDGVTSEQIINGRKDVYLDRCPVVKLRRSYVNILNIPSYDHLGTTLAPEFYIYKVNANLTPNTSQPFNLGLSRLETSELLEDANGLPGAEGIARRTEHPLGTNLYFSTSQQVYSGLTEPAIPSENIWWYNINTCVTQKWVPNETDGLRDGTGSWVEVTDQERLDHWFGSSNVVDDPHVNYLAYSNEDGSVFGLIELV